MLKKYFVYLLLLLVIRNAYGEPPGNNRELNGTVFFNLKDRFTRNTASDKLRLGLKRIAGVNLRDEKEVGALLRKENAGRNCFDKNCAVKLGSLLEAVSVITGTINRTVKRSSKTLKKIESDKYVVQVFNRNVYRLMLEITDIKTGRTIGTIEEESPGSKMDGAVENALKKIEKIFGAHYTARRHFFSSSALSIDLMGAYITPRGIFGDIAGRGYGVKIKPQVKGAFLPNSVFQVSASAYSYESKSSDIDTFTSLELSFLAGYSFDFPMGFSLVPLVGTGYTINKINNSEGDTKFYYDPHLTISLDIGYLLFTNLRLSLSPFYTRFFEEDNDGEYFGISAGAGIHF